MALEHTNRRGDCYYIFQGKTKTGKPKYYASKREGSAKGVPVDSLPEEFEIYENPGNGTVTVRRRKASRVLPPERDLVDRLAAELSAHSNVQTVIDGDRIVVYTPDTGSDDARSMAEGLEAPFALVVEHMARRANFSAEMRFTLEDVDQRTYSAERYCYRGAIDGWIPISGPAPLEALAQELLPHLGKESFYELI